MSDFIFTYTRQQAIEDGIFTDVSEVARRNGFVIPVALTTNLFLTHIKKDDEQDTNRRLNIFLLLMQQAIRNAPKNGDNFLSTPIHFDDKTPTTVWAVIEAQSPTDPSPAMNIMLPEDY